MTNVFEDSKILSETWSDSRPNIVGPTQKLSAMQAPQRTKKPQFILTPLDFLKRPEFRPLNFWISGLKV